MYSVSQITFASPKRPNLDVDRSHFKYTIKVKIQKEKKKNIHGMSLIAVFLFYFYFSIFIFNFFSCAVKIMLDVKCFMKVSS